MAGRAAGTAITFMSTVNEETLYQFVTFRDFVAALVDDSPLAISGSH